MVLSDVQAFVEPLAHDESTGAPTSARIMLNSAYGKPEFAGTPVLTPSNFGRVNWEDVPKIVRGGKLIGNGARAAVELD